MYKICECKMLSKYHWKPVYYSNKRPKKNSRTKLTVSEIHGGHRGRRPVWGGGLSPARRLDPAAPRQVIQPQQVWLRPQPPRGSTLLGGLWLWLQEAVEGGGSVGGGGGGRWDGVQGQSVRRFVGVLRAWGWSD